ncbi:hypothetical protein PHYC_02132 [Phycisphaerales bacterium]|nr:hypothetical protein PHYC_02132 [Phycisphaerales bacterium]
MSHLVRILVVAVLLAQSLVGTVRPACGVVAMPAESACPCCASESPGLAACDMDDQSDGCGCIRSTRGEPAPVPASQDSRPLQEFVVPRAIGLTITLPVVRGEPAGRDLSRRLSPTTQATLCVWLM